MIDALLLSVFCIVTSMTICINNTDTSIKKDYAHTAVFLIVLMFMAKGVFW